MMVDFRGPRANPFYEVGMLWYRFLTATGSPSLQFERAPKVPSVVDE